MGNVVLTTPRSWNPYGLRPFVSGGIGLLHATATDALEFSPVNTNLLGYNVGGGAVGFLNDRVGLRFDLRYFRNLKPSDDPENAIGPRAPELLDGQRRRRAEILTEILTPSGRRS